MKSKLLRLLTVILVFVLAVSFVAPVASAMFIPFVDVPQNAWFFNAVAWAHTNGLASGTSPTTFSPHRNISRGQFVVFLHRIERSPRMGNTIRFHDVSDPSQYYFHAVNWASDNGIVAGIGGGNFAPNRNITREEMAVILFRFAGYQGRNRAVPASSLALNHFSDRHNISNFAQEGMRWAAHNGILRGSQSGPQNLLRIHPRDFATRAEAIAVIQRYVFDDPFTLPPLPPQLLAPPQPDNSHSIRLCPINGGRHSNHRFPGRFDWSSAPDMIVMHTTAGGAQGSINWSYNSPPPNRVSYHFVICRNGTITEIVPITDAAWGNGTTVGTGLASDHRFSWSATIRNRFVNANHYTVSIGFGDAGPTGTRPYGTHGQISQQQIIAGAWLVRHIRYEIWRIYGVTIPIDRSTVVGHNEVTPRSTGTPPHGCPGPLFPFDQIIDLANSWR